VGILAKRYKSNFQTSILRSKKNEVPRINRTKVSMNGEGITHETVVATMCEQFQIHSPQLSQWVLYRTAITGYLICLIKQEKIIHFIEKGRWVFRTV
jgi:hypothetical protein